VKGCVCKFVCANEFAWLCDCVRVCLRVNVIIRVCIYMFVREVERELAKERE